MTDALTPEALDALSKICKKCKEPKPITAFWLDKGNRDDRRGTCASCTNQVRQERGYKPNTEGSRRYRQRHPGRFAEQRRAWEAANPIKADAQRKVRNAVRDGRLIKASACEVCAKSVALHGHHDDYSQALVVRWLCPSCHKKAHALDPPADRTDDARCHCGRHLPCRHCDGAEGGGVG